MHYGLNTLADNVHTKIDCADSNSFENTILVTFLDILTIT